MGIQEVTMRLATATEISTDAAVATTEQHERLFSVDNLWLCSQLDLARVLSNTASQLSRRGWILNLCQNKYFDFMSRLVFDQLVVKNIVFK